MDVELSADIGRRDWALSGRVLRGGTGLEESRARICEAERNPVADFGLFL